MTRKIKIDRSRLAIIERISDQDRGELMEAERILRELRNTRIHLVRQRQVVEDSTYIDQHGARERLANLGALAGKIEAMSSDLEIAEANQRASQEQATASGTLFENCTKLLGAR